MVYFISDLHLGAGYIDDKRAHERRIVAFLESIADDATELYLLGDILDYWFEYRYVVPRGHVRFFGALARLADRGVKISWFVGNHDVWLRDYLRDEIGMTVYQNHAVVDILGEQFLLSHGDDIGKQQPLYKVTRYLFHNKLCQWLYAAVHPRWTVPIATGWSKTNRTGRKPEITIKLAKQCVENLNKFANDYSERNPNVKYFIFGHLHIAKEVEIVDNKKIIYLGEWIKQNTYACFDGITLSLRKWDKC